MSFILFLFLVVRIQTNANVESICCPWVGYDHTMEVGTDGLGIYTDQAMAVTCLSPARSVETLEWGH